MYAINFQNDFENLIDSNLLSNPKRKNFDLTKQKTCVLIQMF